MAATDPDRPNLILTNDLPDVRLAGRFERIDAPRSRSAQVLRSTGGGPHRVEFVVDPGRRGYYRLFVWWPDGAAEAAASFVVSPPGKRTPLASVPRAGQWNRVGEFELPASGASLAVERVGAAPLVVDALRLEYIGEQAPPLALTTTALPIATTGESYHATLEVSGSVGALQFSVAGGLPPGLTLDANAGLLSGVPEVPGSYAFDVEVFDSNGHRTQRAYGVEVVRAPLAPASGPQGRDLLQKDGVAAGTPPDLSNLVSLIAALPEGAWVQASLNSYSDVWAPAELRPLNGLGNPDPSKIILAWSGFAWDPNRGDLLIYGGGHANYSGNDVYRWRGSTRSWERASLPSQIKQDDLGNFEAIDGWDAAPGSAHTYDTNSYFPHIDRMVVFGGAAYNSGEAFMREATPTTLRTTGPFFFDPAKASPDKVGGTTGSHVQRVAPHPEIVGGNMWANRDVYVNIPGNPTLPGNFVDGCAAYAEENGKDVAYLGARPPGGSTSLDLYKYTVNALSSPALDTFALVGIDWNGTDVQTACGFDPTRKLFVRTGMNDVPFLYWDLNTPGVGNRDVVVRPADPSGEFASLLTSNQITLYNCGLDFDAARNRFALWCGDGRVWMLTPPATASPLGWTIVRQPAAGAAQPNGDVGSGIAGKWKYITNLDAFIGLQDVVQGNIWVYKPVGWVNPKGPQPPRPPTNVAASDGTSTTNVAITWSASANATSYTVYRSTALGTQGSSIGTSSSTSFSDTSATPATIYYYGVTASGAGGTSVLSAQNSGFRAIVTPPPTPPLAPAGVNASDGTSTTSVAITWTASANATGYTVYRSTVAGTQGSVLGTTSGTSFSDTSATPGTIYYYGVTASGGGGTSALSAQNSGFRAIAAPPPTTGGSLSGSAVMAAASVDLTSIGALDWSHWPPQVRKLNGGALISNYSAVGGASVSWYATDPRRFTWSNGTPTALGDNAYALTTTGVGKGFAFSVAADTSPRTVTIYVGGANSGGKLTAHLSDGSATDYVDASLSAATRYDGVYVLTYKAATSGQQLTVTWTQLSGAGSVSLQAVALQ